MNFAIRGVPTRSARDDIRRIWTTSGYRTVDGHEGELTLWHLPGEKRRGFLHIFDVLMDESSWFWTSDRPTFSALTARAMHIDRSLLGYLGDAAIAMRRRVLSGVKSRGS